MAKRKTRAPEADSTTDEDLKGGDPLATKAWKCWRDSSSHLREWCKEARESYDFVAGKQWSDEDIKTLIEQQRVPVTFNRTGVVLDAVSGYEINGRRDVTYIARENSDSGPSQVVTQGAKYFRQECDAEDEESDSFFDVLTCGLGWTEHRMDFEDDPEGMLKVERVDPLEMRYDRAAMKRNLVDRRWDIRGKWWDREVAKAKFPDGDFSASGMLDEEGDEPGKPVDREAAAHYTDDESTDQSERRKDQVFILEYTWFENEKFISAINPTNGKMEDTDAKTLKAVNEKLASIGQPPTKSVNRTRKKFKRAFIHGGKTLEEGDAPCPEHFHYQPMTGKRDRNSNTWYGLVRPMKDPQRWANKWLSQTMHLMNANAKGGLIYEDGAIEDVADAERRLAKPGFVLKVNAGYGEKVHFKDPSQIPNTTFQLTELAISSVRDASGVNVELLGMADRDQPGVLEHARKQSAMAILAPFFDAQRRYRKAAGRLTLYFIKTYLSDGRLIRIVGKGPAEYVPLTKQQGFEKYDVIVDESPTSPNAKEAVFAALSQILPMVIKEGMPVPPSLLQYVPGLPAELAEEWKKLIEKPNPEAEKAQQLDSAQKLADIQKTEADAEKSKADATATMAGQQLDMATGITQILNMLEQMKNGQFQNQMQERQQQQAEQQQGLDGALAMDGAAREASQQGVDNELRAADQMQQQGQQQTENDFRAQEMAQQPPQGAL